MIEKAREENPDSRIQFNISTAEEITFNEQFDIIFCNSVMQWFKDIEIAFARFHKALKPGGKLGIQAPAKKNYCPNFRKGIKSIFSRFRNPWFFYETEDEYQEKLKQHGFNPVICRIDKIETKHKSDEVFDIFNSGAAADYLNQDFYDIKIDDNYINDFRDIINKNMDELNSRVIREVTHKLEFGTKN